jgi:putative transcriptional regulator
MSMIENHPSSEMLMNYAMGNTKEAESLIISSHIAYCPICKAEVAKYESIGGFYLRNHEELKLTNSLWNKVLERVDGLDQDDKSTNYVDHKLKTSLSNDSIRIPSFLHHYIENNDTNKWSSTINNVKYFNLKFKDDSYKGKMLEIPPGKSMPKHSHEGLEATMVFHGGYSDESGNYNKGDLVILSGDEEHSPVSSQKTGCLCLVIYSGSLKFKGILGSILNLSKF